MSSTITALEILLGQNDPGIGESERKLHKTCYTYTLNNSTNKRDKIRFDHLYQDLKKLQLFPSSAAEDLFVVACAAYASDTRINRYQHAQDSWTRNIKLYIPVNDVRLWNKTAELLSAILNFLTGDLWEFDFRDRFVATNLFVQFPSSKIAGMPYITDTICLFSGGMDSFIGAYDLLKKGKVPLLIGHSKSTDVSYFRNSAFTGLKTKFSDKQLALVKAYVRIDKQKDVTGREDSERGRSFLFLALGILTASSLDVPSGQQRKLIVPENGMITLNLALTPLRLGAYSTRTTHPHLLNLVQDLVNMLNLAVKIENPYQFKTKGEMLSETQEAKFISDSDTMSCSRPATRNSNIEGKGYKHCGRCVPCIIRRAALKYAGIPDDASKLPLEKQYRFDILRENVSASNLKGENLMAFKYLINRSEKSNSYLEAMIRITGPLDNVGDYLKMYSKGVAEVKALIDPIRINN